MSNDNDMTVFLIDDDDVACEAVERSLKKHDVNFPIVMAHDGLEAMEILRGQHASKVIKAPFVILLDLNMPRMSGLEFLQEMRSDPSISSNVVFILTTSNDDSDRAKAYEENIAGYMVKSSVGPQFNRLANLLKSYKCSVTLPV